MKRTLAISELSLTVFVLTLIFIGVQTSAAAEEHHPPGTADKAATAPGSTGGGMMGPGMMGSGGGCAKMMGVMGQGGDQDGRDMMGMMDKGMMGMMDHGMMPMMMAHMMGGPGGMGKMLEQMGSGMQGGGGPGAMAHMACRLDNLDLTPEQWDQVRSLAAKRLDKMADLWAQRMKLQIGLASLRWDKDVDPQKVKDLFVKMADAKADMFLAGRQYLAELKGILTPEQLQKFEGQNDGPIKK